MTNHLAKALSKVGSGRKLDTQSLASAIMDSLFKLKVSDHADSEEEEEELDKRLAQFILLLSNK
jgi:hypothetical protein